MSGSAWVRQIHRWVSIVFTLTVVLILAVQATREPPEWLYFLPLLPLVVMIFTGLYLFALPYAARWRGARSAAAEG